MNRKSQIVTFKLSVLSTWLLCITANSFASDIEIYQKPKAADGKARIMLNLDNSSFMANLPSGNQSPGSIYEDFGASSNGMTCSNGNGQNHYSTLTEDSSGKYFIESETKSYGGVSYTYSANFCVIEATKISSTGKQDAITSECLEQNIPKGNSSVDVYKCYDRFTRLRRSVLSVINDQNLGENISIGLSFFPRHIGDTGDTSKVIVKPLQLTTDNRKYLSDITTGIRISLTNEQEKTVPVSKGYGESARALLTRDDNLTPIQADQCSGYGIYTLTSGIPVSDVMADARNNLNVVLKDTSQIQNVAGQCPDGGAGGSLGNGEAWQCIATGAQLLMNGKAKISMPVKSAVVSFGTGFSFYPPLSPYDPEKTSAELVKQIEKQITDAFTSSQKELYYNKEYAAISGVVGGGGYYTANDTETVSRTILDFIAKVAKVDIPYLTTGAPTIPQDPLNNAIVQDHAYFPQFKPTPDQKYQLWSGNLKKYKVTQDGKLVDKRNIAIINSFGMMVDNFDLWSPTYDANVVGDENTPGSLNFALMGGAKSQLQLRTSLIDGATVVNRKLLTNRIASSSGGATTFSGTTTLKRVTLNYLTEAGYKDDPNRGYLMALLGYKVSKADAQNPSSITAESLATLPELRQFGAVMHSSPLLFTNQGKMTYTDGVLGSSDRKDYVMYGTTQGLLHVVDAVTGQEQFAFVPNEMVENQSEAFLSADSTNEGTNNLFYGIDAPWTAYTEYVLDADGKLTVGIGKNSSQGKQTLYGGLRMGGRSYYALDVRNVGNPVLKFRINPGAASSSGTPLSYMGQSWSKPKMAWVKWGGQRKQVMFVGGGYDTGYESDSYSQDGQDNPIGAGVYMFDAENGDLLWWASDNADATSAAETINGVIALKNADLKYSVVSEIKTADRDNDGLADHLYFGDLGGQVFRVDLDNKAATIGAFATRAVRLLNLHQTNGASPRFYEAPAFSTYKDPNSGELFAVISIGSGNRSLPLKTYAIGTAGRMNDALYNIYDKDVISRNLYGTISLRSVDATLANLGKIDDTNRFSNNTLVAPYGSYAGWYYPFSANNELQTLKAFNTPAVIDYDLYISAFDASKTGYTGGCGCGGGVKGESQVSLFCMPFGQCAPGRLNSTNSVMDLGSGIRDFAVGATDQGLTRLITGETSQNTGSVIPNQRYGTQIKLIPQRWYEK